MDEIRRGVRAKSPECILLNSDLTSDKCRQTAPDNQNGDLNEKPASTLKSDNRGSNHGFKTFPAALDEEINRSMSCIVGLENDGRVLEFSEGGICELKEGVDIKDAWKDVRDRAVAMIDRCEELLNGK